jgi:hypothetical protein
MKLKSILIGIGAVLFMGGTAWSVGNTLKVSPWDLAPKLSNFKPDPNDTAFYYPLPEVVEVTSPYGYRNHPLSGDRRLHSGEDLGAPEGMPVLAAHSGYVDYTGWDDGYGNLIVLRYADGQYETWYAHLSEILVKQGEPIRARQVIGKVGSTGGVTGPHLHLEIRKKDGGDFVAIDPAAQLKAAESYVAYKPPEPGQREIAAKPAPNPPQPEKPIPLTEKPIQPAPESSQPAIANAESVPNSSPSEAPASVYQAPGMQPQENASLNFDPSTFGR